MPIPSGFKNKEEYAAYMREYRKRKKAQISASDHELKTRRAERQLMDKGERRFATESPFGEYAGQTYPISAVTEQMRKHGFATDSGLDAEMEACQEKRVRQFGETYEEAWRKCEKGVRVNRDVKTIPRSFAVDKKQSVKKTDKKKFKPKIVEKTFCGFCSQMHPTQILCEDGTIKSFPLNTFHVRPEMRIDSLGLTREATNMERCISAIMDTRGVSQEEAEGVCKQLLEDPIFKHDFLNHPMVWKKSELPKPTKEDKYVAAWVSLNKDSHPNICHPEIGALVFHKEEKEAARRVATVDKTVEGLNDIYGKTKEQLIAETITSPKYSGRLTVGDIYAEKQKKKREKDGVN